VRVALQALAAVLGGTQSLHCNGKDEALALPTEESATIALRTQQIILRESGVANTVDPVGGSYAIEEMTTRIEREASELLERIDRLGGTLAAIESGYIQQQIQDAAYRAQQSVDAGDLVVVGVNQYADAASPATDVFRIDPDIERRQVERVRAVRASRSEREWRTAVDAVATAARDTTNLVPPIIAAVEARATLGEIADAMRSVFGEHQDAGSTS
jgi:methylmalonyl-CoA mutase N-terminal domain/subunit